MPSAPARVCPRCRQAFTGKRCTDCLPAQRAQHDRHRDTATQRGYNHHWRTTVRPSFLRHNPLCTLCGQLAEVPDHYPTTRRSLVEAGITDPDAHHRMRPLCTDCHNRYGARD